ncbi:MAG: alpha/beta hydrolase [Bacteroidaceae bacterium]|nr:alpha/beta hydrolase [Bacteroidaceae bacterium]
MAYALCSVIAFAQSGKFTEHDVAIPLYEDSLRGKLIVPTKISKPMPVVLIIAGSGPTDMNGNTIAAGGMTNNSLKMLAEELAQNGIASLRYDKRGIGTSAGININETELRFEHYVSDAQAWIDFLQHYKEWSSTTIIGHSEGSLIGMIAASKHQAVTNFVSIAGVGRPAYKVIEEQLAQQPQEIRQQVAMYNNTLRLGITISEVPAYLEALYRKSVQPYLISWFKYDPQNEINKLQIPTLIVQGDTDIQVKPLDAELLTKGALQPQQVLIPEMNHVLKRCASLNQQEQLLTYSNPTLPLHPSLVPTITNFIKIHCK